MISLVFAFKVTVFVRLESKVCLTQITQIQFPKLPKIIAQVQFPQHLSEIEIHKFPFQA